MARETQRSRKTRRSRAPRRITSLDGIRVFAILSVVLYHLHVPWLPSGHMGVVMFLVLGGYLASSTVLRTMRYDGSSSLPRLWVKRIARVWPSTAAMIACTVVLCALFNHVLLTKLKPDLIPSLLLSNNIGAILRGASYFDNLGGTSPLTHLWYLGVDLQFFLVWTAIVTVLCPRGRSKRVARHTALVLAVVSAVLMGVLYDPNADPTRVYYGPDTRAFAPLLGAWLGLAWPLGGRPVRLDRNHHTVRSLPLNVLGPVAFVGIVVIMVVVPDTSPFLYRGGMFLVSLLSVLLLASLLDRKSVMYKVFSLPPLVAMGTRAFALYLWHFPLFQLFKVTNANTSPAMIALAVALSVLCAELSYRLIEAPIAKNKFPLVIGNGPDPRVGGVSYLTAAPALLMALVVAGGAAGLLAIPDETAVPEGAIVSTGAGAAEAMDLSSKKQTSSSESSTSSDDQSSTSSDSKSSTSDSSSTEDKDKDKESSDEIPTGSIYLQPSSDQKDDGTYNPVLIADSIAGDAQWYLEEHVTDSLLDSYVGRRPDQALSVLESYLSQDVVGDVVVLCTFSNTPTTDDVMDELVDACGDRSVYLVNVRIPEVERDQINDSIARCVERHDNAQLIDWFSYSDAHDEWFYDDATHLTPEGQPQYIDLITNAIAADYKASGGEVLSADEGSSS